MNKHVFTTLTKTFEKQICTAIFALILIINMQNN